jgi:hypothetical protein
MQVSAPPGSMSPPRPGHRVPSSYGPCPPPQFPGTPAHNTLGDEQDDKGDQETRGTKRETLSKTPAHRKHHVSDRPPRSVEEVSPALAATTAADPPLSASATATGALGPEKVAERVKVGGKTLPAQRPRALPSWPPAKKAKTASDVAGSDGAGSEGETDNSSDDETNETDKKNTGNDNDGNNNVGNNNGNNNASDDENNNPQAANDDEGLLRGLLTYRAWSREDKLRDLEQIGFQTLPADVHEAVAQAGPAGPSVKRVWKRGVPIRILGPPPLGSIYSVAAAVVGSGVVFQKKHLQQIEDRQFLGVGQRRQCHRDHGKSPRDSILGSHHAGAFNTRGVIREDKLLEIFPRVKVILGTIMAGLKR